MCVTVFSIHKFFTRGRCCSVVHLSVATKQCRAPTSYRITKRRRVNLRTVLALKPLLATEQVQPRFRKHTAPPQQLSAAHAHTQRRSGARRYSSPPAHGVAPPRDEREETLKNEEEGRTKRQGAGRGKQHVSALEAQQCHTQVCTAYHADRPLHQHQHISQAGGCSEGGVVLCAASTIKVTRYP
eukprot:gene7678-5383_t